MLCKTMKKHLSNYGTRQLKQVLYTTLNYIDIMVPTSNYAKKMKVGKIQEYLRFNIVYKITAKEIVCFKEVANFFASCIFFGFFGDIEKILNATFELAKSSKYDNFLNSSFDEFIKYIIQNT